MSIDRDEVVRRTTEHVRRTLEGEASGHDWWHVYRVWRGALAIAEGEPTDRFVVELAALLHDDPEHPPVLHASAEGYYASQATAINHFYEKLLLLSGRMNTETGRRIAQGRHAFLEQFLARFLAEWDGRDGD